MKWLTAARALAILVALMLITCAANLVTSRVQFDDYTASQAREQAQQRAAGVVVERKLCQTLGAVASLQPPPGNPKTNPSRAYDDQLHARLGKLGPDLGCAGHS